MIITIKDKQEFDTVIASNDCVVVDFFAEWCGPCKRMNSVFEDVVLDMPNITIAKIDVDQHGALAEQYNVRSLPSFFLFQKGQQTSTKIGSMDKSAFIQWIKDQGVA